MVVRIGQKSARPRRTFFKEWREHRGLTQEQLAERLGTNKSGVSKIERGENRYNQSNLEAWADALQCEPSDLISRLPPRDVPGDHPAPPGGSGTSGATDVRQLFEALNPEARRIVENILKSAS